MDNSLVEQRILEQACRLRRAGGVTGWAALRWQGASFFTGYDVGGELRPVPLLLGRDLVRGDACVRVSHEQTFPEEILECGGIRCIRPDRALFDEVRQVYRSSLREAVVAADMTFAANLVDRDAFVAYVAARTSWTGVPGAREVAALSCEGSRSPQESRMRLVWVLDAELPTPLLNQPVYDLDGRLLGVPDLLDPVAGVVGEYDGGDHRRPERHRRDVARLQQFRDHGLECFVVVQGDLRNREVVRRRMLSTRDRALSLPEGRRQWTLTPVMKRAA